MNPQPLRAVQLSSGGLSSESSLHHSPGSTSTRSCKFSEVRKRWKDVAQAVPNGFGTNSFLSRSRSRQTPRHLVTSLATRLFIVRFCFLRWTSLTVPTCASIAFSARAEDSTIVRLYFRKLKVPNYLIVEFPVQLFIPESADAP